jgi:flagellar capping protein FliD
MNNLRYSASNPYKTVYGKDLAFLAQIGIFTKKPGSFDAKSEEWATASMGLLNIDLEQLRTQFKTHFDGIEQLFANSTTGDTAKDTGVAVMVNNNLKMGLSSGSFIERRIASNDKKIADNKTEIDNLNKSADDYELQQRVKYGQMNQAIQDSDSKQKWLSGQFKQQ